MTFYNLCDKKLKLFGKFFLIYVTKKYLAKNGFTWHFSFKWPNLCGKR